MLALTLCALVSLSSVHAQSGARMIFDPLADGIALGLLLPGAGLLELGVEKPAAPWTGVLDPATVNPLDRAFIAPYSPEISTVCDIGVYTNLALPGALALIAPQSDWAGLAAGYAEAVSAAIVLKNVLKLVVDRDRPYAYVARPGDDKVLAELDQSFPSGHTAISFAAASYLITVLIELYPDSPAALPLGIGAGTLALATGVLRMAAGEHFLTDVLAGAAIGSACGIASAELHIQRDASLVGSSSREPSLSLSAGTLWLRLPLP